MPVRGEYDLVVSNEVAPPGAGERVLASDRIHLTTGARGLQGRQGTTGPQGEKGETGPAGRVGREGSAASPMKGTWTLYSEILGKLQVADETATCAAGTVLIGDACGDPGSEGTIRVTYSGPHSTDKAKWLCSLENALNTAARSFTYGVFCAEPPE